MFVLLHLLWGVLVVENADEQELQFTSCDQQELLIKKFMQSFFLKKDVMVFFSK